jgi:hypothetical protein
MQVGHKKAQKKQNDLGESSAFLSKDFFCGFLASSVPFMAKEVL